MNLYNPNKTHRNNASPTPGLDTIVVTINSLLNNARTIQLAYNEERSCFCFRSRTYRSIVPKYKSDWPLPISGLAVVRMNNTFGDCFWSLVHVCVWKSMSQENWFVLTKHDCIIFYENKTALFNFCDNNWTKVRRKENLFRHWESITI